MVQKSSDDDNSASGYFKWIINSDHLAHETIYEVASKDHDAEDSFGAAQSLGDVYKGIWSFVKNDVLSEDYIRTLITRYNDDKSESNQNKLESICFKNHHLIFYHVMDLLRLVEYLSFKTPSLSILFHFINDRELLMKLKDIYVAIFEVIGNQTYLDFYIKILDEIEKRIKRNKDTTETWSEWFVNSVYQDEKGRHQKLGNIEDDDSNICSTGEQREEQLDEEDMYLVFSSINDTILSVFCTWEKIFIMHGKNKDISDLLSNLMKQHLDISIKQNEFKNALENELLVGSSRHKVGEDSANSLQLTTVSSILYFLDISIPESAQSKEFSSNFESDDNKPQFLCSTQEYQNVVDLMLSRMESIYETFGDVFGDSDSDPIYANLQKVYHAWFLKESQLVKSEFKCDEETTEAFEQLVGYIMIKDNK